MWALPRLRQRSGWKRPLDKFLPTLLRGFALIPDVYAEIPHPRGTLAAFLEFDLGREGRKLWKEKI